MASSPDALVAAQEYRTQQNAIRAAVLADAVALWPVLDKVNISRSSPDWLRLLTALVHRWWRVSAVTGTRYYTGARRLDNVPGTIHLTLPPRLLDETVWRNLLYTGPGTLDRAAQRGLTPEAAGVSALVRSSETAARLALQGGRDAIDQAVEKDDRALGWMRVTDGDPCSFCAMLASRGAVYKTFESAGMDQDPRHLYQGKPPVSHWHDSCGCQVVPVFTHKPAYTREAQRFGSLWASSTAGLSGNDARIAFRRAIEGR